MSAPQYTLLIESLLEKLGTVQEVNEYMYIVRQVCDRSQEANLAVSRSLRPERDGYRNLASLLGKAITDMESVRQVNLNSPLNEQQASQLKKMLNNVRKRADGILSSLPPDVLLSG